MLKTYSTGFDYLRTNVCFRDGGSGMFIWSNVTAATGVKNPMQISLALCITKFSFMKRASGKVLTIASSNEFLTLIST